VNFTEGGVETPFDDGIQKFLENNKDIAKNSQNSGAGSATNTGVPSSKVIKKAEFDALPASVQSDFVLKDGGKVVD